MSPINKPAEIPVEIPDFAEGPVGVYLVCLNGERRTFQQVQADLQKLIDYNRSINAGKPVKDNQARNEDLQKQLVLAEQAQAEPMPKVPVVEPTATNRISNVIQRGSYKSRMRPSNN